MCEVYPSFQSCCGIPLRIALIFIAVLSIVTGALINAILKKAGVDPSSIQSDFEKLKNATLNDFAFEEKYDDEMLLESPSTEYIDTTYEDVETTTRRHSSKKTTYGPSTVEIIGEDGNRQILRFTNDEDDDPPNKPEQRPRRNRRFKANHGPTRRSKTTESSNKLWTSKASAILVTAEWPFQDTTQSSEEDIVVPFQDGGPPPKGPNQGGGPPPKGLKPDGGPPPKGLKPDGGPPPKGLKPDGGPPPKGLKPDGGPPPKGLKPDGGPPPKGLKPDGGGGGAPNQGKGTKKESKKKTSNVQLMRAVNTTGLNFLGLLFIALGILLFIANFMNSPELMFLYVVLCISKCIIMLALLISVLVQCARARNICLMRQLDWFTGFTVTIFWFLYTFLWAFFAAVANGYANHGWGNAL